MSHPSFWRFAYATLTQNKAPKVFHTRDGVSFGEVAAVLHEKRWTYKGLIYNYPQEPGVVPPGNEEFSFLHENDWLVLTTRPPIHDKPYEDFRFVRRSNSGLENAVFDEFQKYFSTCSRGRVRLKPEIGRGLSKAEVQFSKVRDGRIVAYNTLDREREDTKIKPGRKHDPYHTLAFFLRSSHIPRYGCGLIGSFGMGGMETTIWNRVVRSRYKDWLARDRFVVAELTIYPPPERPITLDFVKQESVKVEVLYELLSPMN